MMKQLFPYAWIFAGLVLSILICLGLILWMLLQFPTSMGTIPADAHFVQEAIHAALF